MFFSLLVVLLLWLLGGLGGLHLFYAGRRSEGFLWLGSAGVFGLGFITDALRIGALAREASGAAPEAPGKKDDDAKASGDGPAVPLGKVAFQFILANWYWLVATLALRLVCYYGGLTEGLDETTFEMIKVLAGSAVAATVIVLLQYTDMRACSVKGVFGATCGLATTLLALKLSGNIEQASTQGPIMTGILVSRATSRWSKRKNAHKDVISPVMALAIVGLVVMSTGFVAYNAYNAALNYPISINDGEPLTIRQMMRESGTSNPFEFIKIVMNDFTIFEDIAGSMTGEMSSGHAMKLLNIPPEQRDTMTASTVKSAFRKQSLRYHPDKYDGSIEEATELQVEINKAQEVLMGIVGRRGGGGGAGGRSGGGAYHDDEEMRR